MTETFGDKAFQYFTNLRSPRNIPKKIQIVNPYKNPEVKRVMRIFYERFYNDTNERLFVFGINHGRFGGGVTGLSFTDPVALREFCGIENSLGFRRELSSKFIYKVIEKFGGTKKFFSKIFLTALYPMTILEDSNNCNYYDDKELWVSLKGEIISSVKEQIKFGARRDVVICLGKKNSKYFEEMNEEFKFFGRILTLEHPRWIMQYRLKQAEKYLWEYFNILKM